MTKLEFIKRLHLASPQFKGDLDVLERLVASLESAAPAESDNIRDAVSSQLKDLQKKWPRSRDFIDWPSFSDWANSSSTHQAVTDLKALFADVTPFERAKLEGIEIDPGAMVQTGFTEVMKHLAGEQSQDFPSERLFNNETEPGSEIITTNRRAAGERLFSKAKIVIPIYPETDQGDINWTVVAQLKTELYGQSYRPKSSKYDKIIKIVRWRQATRQKNGWTWKEIGDSVDLSASTAKSIYDRACEFLNGKKPKTRNGDREPSLREKLTRTGDMEAYIGAYDPEQDECFKCDQFAAISSGRFPNQEQYAKLSKYLQLPPYPGRDPFICRACLENISVK